MDGWMHRADTKSALAGLEHMVEVIIQDAPKLPLTKEQEEDR